MTYSRRNFVFSSVAAGLALSFPIAGCGRVPPDPGATRLTVLGAIHARHRRSERYSLDVLREAVRRAKPDVIIAEIPPDRIEEAKRSFSETGRVTEPRTTVFPEYTDVVFPLTREMDFDILPGAGWTREIADNRRAALNRIENDPERADQWAEHLAARRAYSRELRGRGDDPNFIHTDEYDAIVEQAQGPYQRYFDPDLGPGGWTQINAAHTDLINSALDSITGKGLNALVTFGSWHKYMIKRSLAGRADIDLLDARELFD